jgi:hypothetical protein
MESCKLFAQADLESILWISASQVARITGVRHQWPGSVNIFFKKELKTQMW